MGRGYDLWVLGKTGQRSRSQCIDNCKWSVLHNCFPFRPIILKSLQWLSISRGYALLVLGSKGQKWRSQCIDNWKWFYCIIDFPLHLSSWNFKQGLLPMSQGCDLLVSGSRSQRSRSQCIDYWKLFMVHNCFFVTHIIMKLHTQTPHELRMCRTGFGFKRSKSHCIDYWKWWFLVHNCYFPFDISVGVGAFVIGLSQISYFLSLPLNLHSSSFRDRFPVSTGYAFIILG